VEVPEEGIVFSADRLDASKCERAGKGDKALLWGRDRMGWMVGVHFETRQG